MNLQISDVPEPLGLTPDDLLVTADEFVRRAAAAVGLAEISPADVQVLAKAIRGGLSRLDVVDILIARVNPEDPRLSRPNPSFLDRKIDSFIVVDLLERYAADDDREFARFAFGKVLGEAATPEELDAAQGFLWRTRDRRAFLEDLAGRRLGRGDRAELSPRFGQSDDDAGLRRIGGQVQQPDGRRSFVVLRHEPGMGWAAGDNVKVTSAIQDGKWKTRSGWIIVGPKQSFELGLWRLNVDLVQPANASVVLDVIANSGVDVFLRATLVGPARCTMRIDVKEWHHFLELRLFKPKESDENNWIDIRDLSFVRAD